MRFILAGSLLAGLNGRSVDLIARNGDARSRAGRPPSSDLAMVDAGAHRRMWRCELEVGGHRRRPGAIVGNGDAAARRARPGRLGIVGCGDARARRKNRLGVSEAASLHAVQGGRNRAGDQGGKPRGLMCSSATLAGFSTYPMRAARRGRCSICCCFFSTCFCSWCCCSSRGTVAKLAMRQPFVLFKGLTFQKLCLPGAFRPGDHHNKMLRPGLCVVHASPQYL